MTTTTLSQVVLAPRGEHSEKPAEVYRRIETMYPDASKCELFARAERPGWVCVGDSKWRAIGAILVSWQRGDRFYMRPQATRNGREYGASSGVREFATAESMRDWRAKYLATGAKRAAR